MASLETEGECGPWNPGLASQIPRHLLPLSTMFREENVANGFDEAHELSDFCGLPPYDIVAFRPRRLIVHELLIRVTADLAVPDGPNYEDLGINLRAITANILDTYIMPEIGVLEKAHEQLRSDAADLIERELSEQLFSSAQPAKAPEAKSSLLDRILGRPAQRRKKTTGGDRIQRQTDAIAEWERRSGDPFETACLAALIKVVNAITGHRGRLLGDPATITRLAVNLMSNSYGSEQLGEAIEPYIRHAAAREDYRFLPAQEKPVVMNVKGASAAGKSTIRPQQRQLAGQIGIPWDDFALISPDYWRKFLLDYESLGDAHKYAAVLTGHELAIVDRKLDRYMALKANRGRISHLLIDRFRFDSFIVEDGRDEDSTLLTRFGDLIFMFFVITPPDATVERAWVRGLKTGRYKAVDDLLHHNIEAFTGMPQLFFSWASASKKKVHYEFLDNSVAEGQRPRTVAFGWNGTMTILDIKYLLDIERFRKINVDARQPEDVYSSADMSAEQNTGFLKQCADLIPLINFADYRTGYIYGRLEQGRWTWRDEKFVAEAIADADAKAGLEAIGWGQGSDGPMQAVEPEDLEKERVFLLGEWNPRPGKAG